MKLYAALLTCAVCTTIAFCDTQLIVCGNSPGGIYFSGVHPSIWGTPGFYYSQDYGENIVLRNSTGNPDDSEFGNLLADSAEYTLYRFSLYIPCSLFLTTDGGFNWNVIEENPYLYLPYASGVSPGEIYRGIHANPDSLERSIDYGISYAVCSCLGGPNAPGGYSIALGSMLGEVYVLGDVGKLYYSYDYAENYILTSDLYQTHGISPYSYLINGAAPGEVFIVHYDSQRIWRITEYGTCVELIADFSYLFWSCGVAASRVPGELYFMAQQPEMCPGGTIHIYHTTDYFQTWTMYEHIVEFEGVRDPQTTIVPSDVELHVYPNPANAAFDILYQLPSVQQVKFKLFNTLGHQVWRQEAGIQSPGSHLWHYHNEQLPSGTYFLQLNTGNSALIKTITIIK